jgi:hypothetical protein
MTYLGKYLKKIQKSFLKMGIFHCIENYIKVIVKSTVFQQIIYIAVYVIP